MQNKHIETLAEQFEDAGPYEILCWASDAFGERLAIVTSFQITGIAALHMIQRIAPRTPVLTLDTGLLFPETHDLINQLEARFQLNLRRVKPRQTPRQQARDYGDRLWERNPDRCCHIRKTIPLRDALEGFDAWVTGLRRDQSAGRANTPDSSAETVASASSRSRPSPTGAKTRSGPTSKSTNCPSTSCGLAGYPSIGCWPCTKAVVSNGDGRSGRWANRAKSECGIHIPLEALHA